ncbi:MAG: hypothetical protein ACE5NC_07620 [Anaerolineae bacterium]
MAKRYLIETPHSEGECLALQEQVRAMGYLMHFDWGCKSGEHNGWAVIEADSEGEVQMVVPPLVREKARVLEVIRYEEDKTRKLHER